jgi:uncharacterized phage-associated protein
VDNEMIHPKFNPQKALEVLLYVVQRHCTDMYCALKIVYFADKKHLARYGRLIAGDHYVAMSHGPVPSGLYDIVKFVRGDRTLALNVPASEAFIMREYEIVPLREPNLDLLSESEQECLTESIREYGRKSFAELKRLSHDKAFASADLNDFISMEDLAKDSPDGEALLEYLKQE